MFQGSAKLYFFEHLQVGFVKEKKQAIDEQKAPLYRVNCTAPGTFGLISPKDVQI